MVQLGLIVQYIYVKSTLRQLIHGHTVCVYREVYAARSQAYIVLYFDVFSKLRCRHACINNNVNMYIWFKYDSVVVLCSVYP